MIILMMQLGHFWGGTKIDLHALSIARPTLDRARQTGNSVVDANSVVVSYHPCVLLDCFLGRPCFCLLSFQQNSPHVVNFPFCQPDCMITIIMSSWAIETEYVHALFVDRPMASYYSFAGLTTEVLLSILRHSVSTEQDPISVTS